MKKGICMLLALLWVLSVSLAPAEGAAPAEEDRTVVTRHTATIAGKEISYTATTGFMTLNASPGAYEIFYTAYTLDPVEDPASRPVTFLFNGGPGSSTMWLHMGMMGPQRIVLKEDGMLPGPLPGMKNNDFSLLDLTDLVFLDPVGVGYSRASSGSDETAFYSYSADIESVGEFIRTYISRNQRWPSPKYLAGESYGTVRAAGLCKYLKEECSMTMNGLMMISAANDFEILEQHPGSPVSYAVYLPTFAAAAWYHGLLDADLQGMKLEDFLRQVCDFAGDEYLRALFMGSGLPKEEREAVVSGLERYTSLPKDFWISHHLMAGCSDISSTMLSGQRKVIGRIDTRFTGPVMTSGVSSDGADPSLNGMTEAFAATYVDYVARVLQYPIDRSFVAMSSQIEPAWDLSDFKDTYLSQENILHDLLSGNPFMKIWVLCGYYDAATPFLAAEYVYSHLSLNEELLDHITFSYYPSGHMIYIHEPSLKQFREEAEAWYR